jgi:hypothetical protein
MENLTEFQAQAAGIALHNLLYKGHFSICDLDKIAKLIGKEVGGKDYEALSAMHCVNWADMPEHLRQQAREKIVELLGLPPLVIEGEKAKTEQAPEPEHGSKLRLAFWKK